MNKPYIGITGFMSRDEVEEVLTVFPENSTRKLMVGVLASEKTLHGPTNKWPNRYPDRSFDTDKTREYLRALEDMDLDIGLGVAGGLSAETLHLVEPLIEEFPDLSIDAEGRLRDESDKLDLTAAKRYAVKSLDMFGRKGG